MKAAKLENMRGVLMVLGELAKILWRRPFLVLAWLMVAAFLILTAQQCNR